MEFLHGNTKSLLDSDLRDGSASTSKEEGHRHRRWRYRQRLPRHVDAAGCSSL